MHGNLDDAEFRATKSDAPPCSDATGAGYDCTDLQGPYWFGLLCRHLWPSKPWLMLMQIAGLKERSTHNYVSGHSTPDARVLRDILRSPDGYRALVFMMQFDPPLWLRDIQTWQQKAALADAFAMGLGNVGPDDGHCGNGAGKSNMGGGTR